MANPQPSREDMNSADTQKINENIADVKNSLLYEENGAVKQALTKEQQPSTESDLSTLHDNQQTGTTGGDQRATEEEIKQSFEPGESRNSKTAKEPKEPVIEDPAEEIIPVQDPPEEEIPVE